MNRLNALILFCMVLLAPAFAVAQDTAGARSIEDLLNRVSPNAPVRIDGDTVRPDGPPTPEEQAYDRRVLQAYQSAQVRQGALDGTWQVQALDGRVLYLLVFTDPNAGPERIEGAWSNPRRTGTAAQGYVDAITREGADTVFAFTESGVASRLKLSPNGAGAWRGESQVGNARTPVVMIRAEGLETRAAAAR